MFIEKIIIAAHAFTLCRYEAYIYVAYIETRKHCMQASQAELCVVFLCRRDLFMAVRLALAKLGAGSAGAEDGDGSGMPSYGTRVTINTGWPRDSIRADGLAGYVGSCWHVSSARESQLVDPAT